MTTHEFLGTGTNTGDKNGQWRDKPGRVSLHEWVRNRLPKPELCPDCNLMPPRDLANISQEYKRELSDWEWLCRKCHMTKDGRLEQFVAQNRTTNKAKCTVCGRWLSKGRCSTCKTNQ